MFCLVRPAWAIARRWCIEKKQSEILFAESLEKGDNKWKDITSVCILKSDAYRRLFDLSAWFIDREKVQIMASHGEIDAREAFIPVS